ncbi:MAG: fructosamine kinase family protein [Methylococcales bacterium]|jgi:fructosamine-3-kinase|nr:fructosamine kinase family protein [Methylococcaceae bacterium]HIL39511.1 fructosamine kinase family protein [Methylococcales bacterium]
MDKKLLAHKIAEITGAAFEIDQMLPVSGGSINEAYQLVGHGQRYFIKFNSADLLVMFEAEYAGLEELYLTRTVSVPQPLLSGIIDNKSFLLLTFVEFGPSNLGSETYLGERLAELHGVQQPFFGWHRDNTIGSTVQKNRRSEDWLSFWNQQRLGFQLQLALQHGYGGRLQQSGQDLQENVPSFFTDYQPQPSLLHGDLWAGNAAVDKTGMPIIFDPACYYGDREADIAMTELFGGFSAGFYSAYNASLKLDAGYRVRRDFYNLYHILNHLNLFGGGYLNQAQGLIDRLLAESK